MKADDRVSGAFLLILAVAVCLQSLDYRLGTFKAPSAGLFPFWMGVLTGILALILLGKATFAPREEARRSESLRAVLSRKKVWAIVLALTAYGLLLEQIGFLLATFIVIAFILRAVEPQKWWVCIIGGFSASVGSYILFYMALGVHLPRGIMGL